MHGGGPTVMLDDLSRINPADLSLDQRLALVERNLLALLGVVHGIHEELEAAPDGETDDGHIDP